MTGDVIIDDRLFDPTESTGSGPHRVSPIMINDNVVDILVQPGKAVGEPASVSFLPPTQFVTMDAQVETVASDQSADLKVQGIDSRRFTVRGRIPAGYHRLVLIHEVDDPASFARALFIEALRHRNVRIDATFLGINTTASLAARPEVARLPKVAQYTSPPFREFIKVILKVSHNLHASTLPLLLAARHGERTLEAGLRRQGEMLKNLGIEPTTVSFGGGAGGSRSDLVTPRPRSRCSRRWPRTRTFLLTRPRCRFSAAMARWRTPSPRRARPAATLTPRRGRTGWIISSTGKPS